MVCHSLAAVILMECQVSSHRAVVWKCIIIWDVNCRVYCLKCTLPERFSSWRVGFSSQRPSLYRWHLCQEKTHGDWRRSLEGNRGTTFHFLVHWLLKFVLKFRCVTTGVNEKSLEFPIQKLILSLKLLINNCFTGQKCFQDLWQAHCWSMSIVQCTCNCSYKMDP